MKEWAKGVKVTIEPHIFQANLYVVRMDALPGERILTETAPVPYGSPFYSGYPASPTPGQYHYHRPPPYTVAPAQHGTPKTPISTPGPSFLAQGQSTPIRSAQQPSISRGPMPPRPPPQQPPPQQPPPQQPPPQQPPPQQAPPQQPPQQPSHQARSNVPENAPHHAAAPTPPASQPPPPAPTPSPAPSQQPAPDPVIHMLAQRASTNMELKQVMRIVASGNANPSQLEYFQRHIDELSAIVKARGGHTAHGTPTPAPPASSHSPTPTSAQSKTNMPTPPVQTPAPAPQPAPASVKTPAPPPPAAPPAPPRQPSASNPFSHPLPSPAPRPPPPPTMQHPQQNPFGTPSSLPYAYQGPQQAHVYRQPLPPRPRIVRPPANDGPVHLLIEFEENTNDRWLFPRMSIIEYQPGFRAATASFLILRDLDGKPIREKRRVAEPATPAVKPEAVSAASQNTQSNHTPSAADPGASATPSKHTPQGASNASLAIKPEVPAPAPPPPTHPPSPLKPQGIPELDVDGPFYYQPVTIRFFAEDETTFVLSALSRAVAPQKDVREYMEMVFAKGTRAPDRFLPLRLPKAEDGDGI
ncbi:hypothetical protein P152DRAFT_456633 [Eremomyces bilateralis CBS 781.70]|uniref:Uncharacterized protein n=1 Tax=Eremomyces bilateralis CBS 781.70 TaxID=1392243 RepID=A0A6G1G8M8_9PEZI|nr:uncharacterized protein P152DRAFT_456633 [Eremomyces bilateralis CBS 781.70]KAF1814383.1 hypothetical protein P152DRAFT_456633 [Eremomyces bilateralis CBS 781.70]